MRFEVVDRDERTAERVGHSLGSIHSDDQCSSKPRSLSDGDGVEIVTIDSCISERLLHHRNDGRHVASRRKLRNHASVAFMEFELRGYNRGENSASSGDDCRGRLVTRRLDSEHDHGTRPSGRSDRATIMSFLSGLSAPRTGSGFLRPEDRRDAVRVQHAGIRPLHENLVPREPETT
jgi:hypothetical protein